ncbi:P-loop containing nucleoside triphosphate hydrolase protein [Fimicolochytrium jonesii]|uniref:P-loop containing nucleoside triphosphate hydrolase protein n=1 Tax=Fimicolochytrium jonesii TaxID=1396493 RepID=UPI0022FF0721|nr:P-loop containing nucleoside triphosphate hydrolase protein [Fimicolochytrium jonesii]KAI8820681.1 P-loop containing nucleoside triphosphate hydrolase protein [Fimicolochytrium jonesii]
MGDSKKTTRLTNREQKLLKQCLVKPNPASASFKKIGGLGRTKRTIHELISFPLMRPELFSSGILSQSTTGILLFGPPGTGKTLLARAVAAESGANFLNVQMSDIQSMWVGENEKNVKSLFTLARKLRPCVIFIDEIDALLRARQRNMAHHTNTINEFMQEWDGLNSNNDGPDADGTGNTGGIIVVGATNRPFDLDEAVLRRLPRRILVSLPDRDARADIVRLCLKDDEVLDRDNLIVQVAEWTEGWSGSDIRNFCIAAGKSNASTSIPTERVGPDVKPPISLAHFKEALDAGDVRPSLNDRAELVKALRDWDKQYGTGAGGARGGAGEWGF